MTSIAEVRELKFSFYHLVDIFVSCFMLIFDFFYSRPHTGYLLARTTLSYSKLRYNRDS
jgi:hypothetical protein